MHEGIERPDRASRPYRVAILNNYQITESTSAKIRLLG